MNNFNLKKYLGNNPLLEGETLDEINVLNIIKKNIKKKFGVDASNDQIRFGDGTPISEESITQLNEFLNEKKSEEVDEETINELKNLGHLQCIRCGKKGKKKKAYFVRGKYVYCNSEPEEECPNALGVHIKKIHKEFIFLNESVNEDSQCSLNEGPGITANLCNLAVFSITSILKSFPVIFSQLGDDGTKKFIQQIFDGNSPQLYIDALEVEIDKEDGSPIFKIVKFPTDAAFAVFNSMVALAIRIFQVASSAVCSVVLSAPDGLIAWVIKAAKAGIGEKVGEGGETEYEEIMREMAKKYNNTGKDI